MWLIIFGTSYERDVYININKQKSITIKYILDFTFYKKIPQDFCCFVKNISHFSRLCKKLCCMYIYWVLLTICFAIFAQIFFWYNFVTSGQIFSDIFATFAQIVSDLFLVTFAQIWVKHVSFCKFYTDF